MYKPELNLLTSFVFYYMITKSKVSQMSKESCLWLNHIIKQISFSVSSNMN